MSNSPSLLNKIASLATAASVTPNGARSLSAGAGTSLVERIISEVDDTVLKRELLFKCAGTSLSVIVSGRRLIALHTADSSLDVSADLFDVALSIEEPDNASAVVVALYGVTANGDELTVESKAYDGHDSHTDLGVPTSVLLDLLEEDDDVDVEDVDDPLLAFLEALEEEIQACAIFSEEESGEIGDPEDVQKLTYAVKTEWASYRQQVGFLKDNPGMPFLACMNGAMDPSLSMFCVQVGETVAAFICRLEDAPTVHSRWGKYFIR